jgi:hypothetical protein
MLPDLITSAITRNADGRLRSIAIWISCLAFGQIGWTAVNQQESFTLLSQGTA